ncbi:1-phosphofructokinase (fructoso 1-phosphate kinase) [Clostridium acetobutylicum EA 2018]|uniref:Tagatose-6-phosphate kinase n=1 Tax=Clostridium acetobutylicum (strain ATCC 824 / DSM 792 / JCM 1419 / IAM 19013 / LMG 5710 / NBRC 13948 / NRRL B-527 / VKM B-1787 / 2291 / W) TaxID=272562 RepID=Q97MG6_CLOAB|nr:1-phosphofructokinase [Clostridium acetobutylicum]AAK78213.1 1-phosphofructokinase (fructoso 1-phosphate kinase) [Clostridium acetobutylicum ATCC 824]ADZ19278.1 1-phosphofructokinase (fructoso 1-phosphate kinase) [Clostridium acetobutylicum EA 2018]AEI33620.1 1-phosphofructokinase (fructoso 1-phosphate kinase) [Clostridium acetobutylicum DSM 1731]MBC2396067.1 1-phosphofructokinase [Clostridium acetobutylicum]MBC2586728.1 1-phosphofructokinase [Clostridium acetobutylicum]
MVITVTLNPAMDKTLNIDNFNVGVVNRVSNIRYDIGGKGINVSKVLKNFNIESKCTGFIGGMWEKDFREELDKRGIKNEFITVSGNTRTNTKIVDDLNKVYTDINEAGPSISSKELEMFMNKFKDMCNKDDIVVLSGGVAPGIPKNIYGTLTKIAKEEGSFVILDAEGELLSEGIKENPYIIKPNDMEFELLLNKKFKNNTDIIDGAKEVIGLGVSNVLISLGSKGALFVNKDKSYYAKGLVVPVKSTVGAGDSMVAAFVYGIINSLNEKEILRFSIACGAASVSTEGTEACSLEDVKELLKSVVIEEV